MAATENAHRLLQIAAQAADDKGGFDQVALDISEPLPLVDIFLLVTGRNERNVIAISNEIEDKMIEAGVVCLPVHDSFVVQAKHRQFLCDTMCNAFREYLNYNGEVFVKVCERLSAGSTRKEIQSW